MWGKSGGAVRILAVITPHRKGKDAAIEIVACEKPTTPIVVDIQSVMAVVGRIGTRGKFFLVDRMGGMVRPEFIPPELDEEEEETELE